MMKKLTERFQKFKKMYNAEIIQVYRYTKEILQRYENRMSRHNVPLEDTDPEDASSDESGSDSSDRETEVATKKPDGKARQSRKRTADEYETPLKVINGKPNVKIGKIVLKRKRNASRSSSSYNDKKRNITPASGNIKKRDAVMRGETIEGVKRRPGRPKMTSSEK